MKNRIVTLILLLAFAQISKGQNTFFIGQKTYASTNKFVLSSDAKNNRGHDIEALIAKNGEAGMFVLSAQMTGKEVRIKGNIIMYLEDGNVLTCVDRGKFDYVNGIATTIYSLTKAEIDKMKNSNISTIRFSLKCFQCSMSTEEGSFSASNKESGYGYYKKEKEDVPSLLKILFNN